MALTFAETREDALADLQRRFPKANFVEDADQATLLGDQVFVYKVGVNLQPKGTTFQQSVWKALTEIPVGETRTYSQIAARIGKSKAVRAVGTAIGANPIAYLIPCHRVIRADGKLGGYRWGLQRKIQMLEAEGL